jgi:outer membrane protein TolC
MQKFPWFGTLGLKGEIAGQEANSLKAEYDALLVKASFEVKETFYELAFLAHAIEISRQETELLTYLESLARTRYAAGAALYDDVIRTQVQLGKQENALRTLEDLRNPIMARLASILNLPEGTRFPMPPSVPVMVIGLSDEEILQQFPDSNPEIKRYQFLEAMEKASLDLSRKQYYPEFNLGIEYENAMGESGFEGMQGANSTDPVRAVVSVNIPFWWERRNAGVREAEAKRLAAQKGNEATRRKLASDIQMALYKYRDALRKIDLYQNTLIPKAEEALEVTLEAFQTGVRSSLDLIASHQTLLEFEIFYIRALADQAQRFAELEMLLGKEIPCEIHGVVLPKHGGGLKP